MRVDGTLTFDRVFSSTPVLPHLKIAGCESSICRAFSVDDSRNRLSILVYRASDGALLRVDSGEGGMPRLSPLGSVDARVVGVSSTASRAGMELLLHEKNDTLARRHYSFEQGLGPLHPILNSSSDAMEVRPFGLTSGKTSGLLWRTLAGVAHLQSFDAENSDVKMGVEFLPSLWPWFDNFAATDLNGDGLTDFAAYAFPSKHIWAAVGTRNGTFEVPIESDVSPSSGWRLVTAADFTGDGLGDLLIFDTKQREWLLGASQSAQPLRNALISFASRIESSGGDGVLCASKNAFHEGEILSSEHQRYRIIALDNYAEFASRLLLRPIVATGAKFSLSDSTIGPYACVGFVPESEDPDYAYLYPKWGQRKGRCPAGFAVYTTGEPSNRSPFQTQSPLIGCCPLPDENILTGPIEEYPSSCPENWISIGAKFSPKAKANERALWSCRRVSERYRLGPARGGAYYGIGFSVRAHRERIRLDQIPTAIRYSADRGAYFTSKFDGCVGNPPGSLLSAGSSEEPGCGKFRFRELQYSGLFGDPPAGSPVPMFPADCPEIDEPFLPTARCSTAFLP